MKMRERWLAPFLCVVLSIAVAEQYSVGAGIADVTGPAAEITFMGYARLEQKGAGIHLRQFSRAFVFDDVTSRILFVSVDCAMISYGLRKEVLEQLEQRYGSVYTEQNVILSATHTHAAPGGFNQYLLYDISVLGFVKQTFNALVSGIVRSVERAHQNVAPGRVFWNTGELLHANINRSPTAYLRNPLTERQRFTHDVDKEMVQLRMMRLNGDAVGAISWFAVHPTSMNNTNTLISSDNVGYASLLMEQRLDPASLPGKSKFVAAFAASNLGDVSPNLKGPHCTDTGEPCDVQSSTCEGANVLCIASGPGSDMFESTSIIAHKLYNKAVELFEGGTEISGAIRSVHQYVDMSRSKVTYFDQQAQVNRTLRGCLPAMGHSFAAGTTDGPGAFTFIQGMTTPNDLWNAVRDFLVTPSDAEKQCHAHKPILIPTGEMKFPFEWQPRIVSTSVARIGEFTIAAVPGEFSTMAGRRLRSAVQGGLEVTQSGSTSWGKWHTSGDGSVSYSNDTRPVVANADTIQENSLVQKDNVPRGPVVIAGLCNTYSSYIVTPEEYKLQRYEAASTIYGPDTLPLYEQQYMKLASSLITGARLKVGTAPKDIKDDLVSLVPPVLFDSTPWRKNFGDCVRQPERQVRPGDTVSAAFISGHPRNNLFHEDTFMTVERQDIITGTSNFTWNVVATDANWDTKYIWYRTSFLLGTSESKTQWTIPKDTRPGVYRLRHKGYAKYFFGGIFPYEGVSRSFQVTPPTSAPLLTRRKFFS